jgi:CopG family nickel-responsive transcriptional regulator
MGELKRTTLAIDGGLLEQFDAWIAGRGYANRSEAVRDLIRAALTEQAWESGDDEVVGVLSLVYDHASRDLAQELTHIQHEAHHAVLCSQHVHMDRHKCLEVVIMRAAPESLRRLADALSTARGVSAGKLSLLSERL